MVMIAKQKYKVIQQTNREDNMNFYYDTSKLKREWSKDNLSNFANFLSEVMRSDHYYKDGWSNGFVEDFDDEYEGFLGRVELRLECGRDEEGHQEKFYETKIYESAEEFYKDYDYYFKKKQQAQANK